MPHPTAVSMEPKGKWYTLPSLSWGSLEAHPQSFIFAAPLEYSTQKLFQDELNYKKNYLNTNFWETNFRTGEFVIQSFNFAAVRFQESEDLIITFGIEYQFVHQLREHMQILFLGGVWNIPAQNLCSNDAFSNLKFFDYILLLPQSK